MRKGNAHYNIYNAVASAVSLNMISPYVGILAIKLGADDLQLGYLSSWPQAASVLAVLGLAAAVERSAQKQRLVALIFLLSRIAALGAAAVPWFPERQRVWALIGFWVLQFFPNAAAGTALSSFLADVFPGRIRGEALASRQAWSTGVGMVIAFVTGWLIDRLPYPFGYQAMFAGSLLFGLLEIYYFLQMKEDLTAADIPERRPTGGQAGWHAYLAVFRHRPFTRFLIFSLLFHFTWQMAWPIFTRYQVSVLGADNTWQGLLTVANSVVGVVSFAIWARWAARFGNRWMMPLAAVWLATAPVLTAFSPNMPVLIAVNLFTGVGVAGVVLLVLNYQLEVSPTAGRPIFLAMHTALVSVSAAIAPMVGAWLMTALPIGTALIICTGCRLVSAAGWVVMNYLDRPGQGKTGAGENILET